MDSSCPIDDLSEFLMYLFRTASFSCYDCNRKVWKYCDNKNSVITIMKWIPSQKQLFKATVHRDQMSCHYYICSQFSGPFFIISFERSKSFSVLRLWTYYSDYRGSDTFVYFQKLIFLNSKYTDWLWDAPISR